VGNNGSRSKFPTPLPERPTIGYIENPEDHKARWESILRLSTLWQFEGIRLRAIEKLESCLSGDPVRRITLARKFKIEQWFPSAIGQLVTREAGLDPEDGGEDRLGFQIALTVAGLREELFKGGGHPIEHCKNCHYCGGAVTLHCPKSRPTYPMTLAETARQKFGTLFK
jgi:hypothetical protein